MPNHLDLPRDEAEELLALPKTAPLGEWRTSSQGRIERWSLAVGVLTESGLYARALVVEFECMRTLKPARECFKLGLFKSEFGAPRRAYQLDTTSCPLCDADGHDWPHEHIGQDRVRFPESGFPSTFDSALEHFQRATNIRFEEPLESPFAFRLR